VCACVAWIRTTAMMMSSRYLRRDGPGANVQCTTAQAEQRPRQQSKVPSDCDSVPEGVDQKAESTNDHDHDVVSLVALHVWICK
jgi:hypothetical protein